MPFEFGYYTEFSDPVTKADPVGAAVARDPYASHTLLKCVLVLLILALAALGVCWKLQYGPFAPKAQEPAPAATVEAQPAVAPAAAPAEAK